MRFLNALTASLCSVVLVVAPVHAQEPLETKSVEVDGRAGVWFPRDDADRVLDVVTRKLPAAEGVIETQKKIIDLQVQQIHTATTGWAQSTELNEKQGEFSDTVLKAYKEEADRNSGLFSEPVFWTLIGVVAGGLIAGGTVWAVTKKE